MATTLTHEPPIATRMFCSAVVVRYLATPPYFYSFIGGYPVFFSGFYRGVTRSEMWGSQLASALRSRPTVS